MAKDSLLGLYSSNMALSDLELYQKYAQDTSIDDQIKSYKKELSKLRRKIKRQHSGLRSFIVKESVLGGGTGVDIDSDPNLASISVSDTVPNVGPLDLLADARDYKFFEKNHVDPTYTALNNIYKDLTKDKRGKLESLVYDLKKSNLRIKELEFFISKMYNLKADKESDKSLEERESDKGFLEASQAYNEYLHKFYGIFLQVTSTESTTEEEDRYRAYMQHNSVSFIHYKKKLISNFDLLPEDLKSNVKALNFKTHLEGLPKHFIGVPLQTIVTTEVKIRNMIDVLYESISNQKENISKEEGIKNNTIEDFSGRIQTMLKSDVYSRIADTKNKEELREELSIEKSRIDEMTKGINDFLSKANKGKNYLEGVLAGEGPFKSDKARRFFKNLAFRTGGIIPTDPDTKKALEEDLRNLVREEYGGNLPFEDEEKVIDKNGKKRFIQLKYLVKVKGVYRIREEVQEEEAAKKYSDKEDVF